MKLCDHHIIKWINKKKIVINPDIEKKNIHGASIDLKLGNKFRVFKGYKAPYVDLSGDKKKVNSIINSIMSHEITLKEKSPFFLHPHELILTITSEFITLPNNIVGWIDGRSSLARLGLMIHVTAHRIDPGWSGKIVLECYNSGKIPLILRPGMIIASLSFELLSGFAKKPYHSRINAKYINQMNTIKSKISEDD
ncbi:MAG: dCTP deaminase [Arsenophonus sp.]|nr:MAG: dCTP deaminase [Arsenophonus sp.]